MAAAERVVVVGAAWDDVLNAAARRSAGVVDRGRPAAAIREAMVAIF